MTGCSGKRNHVADVRHSGDQLNRSFEPQSKTAVRNCAEAAQVRVPPVVFRIHSAFFNPLQQDVEAFFPLAASDDFSDARNQHVHRAYGFAIIVAAHVKRFDGSRIVEQDHRLLEMFFGQEPFMFALQIMSPFDRIFELLSRRIAAGRQHSV